MFITCIYFLVGCGAQKPQHACGGQKDILPSRFSPPTMWALGHKLRSTDSRNCFNLLSHLSCPPFLCSPLHAEIFMMCLHCIYDEHIFNFNLKIQVAKQNAHIKYSCQELMSFTQNAIISFYLLNLRQFYEVLKRN